MIEAISIGATCHLPAIRARLKEEFYFLRKEGFIINIREEPRGNLVFLGCRIKEGDKGIFSLGEARSLFRHFIANALAEIIISCWEKNLLAEMVRQNYHYFSPTEQQKILELACQNLNGEGKDKGTLVKVNKANRKNKILYKLLDYLEGNNEIVLEGFIRFRLKEYLEELREAADRAVDDLMLEQEYKEFIRLLRYFLEVQEPKQREIHVLLGENVYRLLNERGEALTAEKLEDLGSDFSENDITCEDFLISTLLSLAPQQVYLHLRGTSPNEEVVKTIKSVFAGRIEVCLGCRLCTGEGGTKGQSNPEWGK